MIQTCRAVLKGGAKQAKSITKLHKEKMHLSDCRNDDEGYLIKKKVGELLVFLHHISLHLLLPNFFPSKTEDYLEKFTTISKVCCNNKLSKACNCVRGARGQHGGGIDWAWWDELWEAHMCTKGTLRGDAAWKGDEQMPNPKIATFMCGSIVGLRASN